MPTTVAPTPTEPRPVAGRIAFWACVAVLVLALPLALLAAMMPVNEYLAMGIDALDCDTPAAIVALAGLVYLLYGAGLAAFGALALRRPARRVRYGAVAVFCLLVMAGVTPNTVRAWNVDDDEACAAR